MEWADVAKKVVKAAPLIGSILGPGGAVVGGVVSLIGSAFGLTSEETTPNKINELLATDPDAALKLARLEATNKVELQKLVLEKERVRLADVASARMREMEITKATGKRDYNLYILAWIVILGFLAITGLLMFVDVKTNTGVSILFGSLSTGFGTVLAYFFGSSKSSAEKTAILAGGIGSRGNLG